MLKIVVDANVVLKWIPGKNEERVEEAREVYKMMLDDRLEIIAPTFLLVEVLNILTNKRKTDKTVVREIMREIIGTKIKFIDLSLSDVPKIEKIIHKYKLTSYDSIYILLAIEKNCKLLTVDRHLLKLHDLAIDIGRFLKLMKSN